MRLITYLINVLKVAVWGVPNVRGWYNTKTDVIRSGNYGEIPVIMHELGHYVDNYFRFQ